MIMSPELIAEFFEDVGVKKQCPACDAEGWIVPPDTEGDGTGVLRFRADGNDKDKLKSGLTYVYVICRNCGFIRPHTRAQIVRWVRAREEAGSAERREA